MNTASYLAEWFEFHRSIRWKHASHVRLSAEMGPEDDKVQRVSLGIILEAQGRVAEIEFYRVPRPDPQNKRIARAKVILEEERKRQYP